MYTCILDLGLYFGLKKLDVKFSCVYIKYKDID